jgi:hypothetical protein
MLVTARPLGRPDPLKAGRRGNGGVLGHGVVRRVVKEVRPLVRVLRPGLDRLGPFGLGLDVRNAAGREHPQDLVHADPREVLRDDEVHEILRVRQPGAGEPLHRGLAVGPELADMLAGRRDVPGVRVQAVNDAMGARGAQGRGESAIPAAEVYDQPALDAGGAADAIGLGRGRRLRTDAALRQQKQQPRGHGV